MGYSEIQCQLCGVSFCIGRLRTADESKATAWNNLGCPGGIDFVEGNAGEECGPETGCCFATRRLRRDRSDMHYNLKSGKEIDNEEWITTWKRSVSDVAGTESGYEENEDSTYKYESDENDEPLEYDSDESSSEVDIEETSDIHSSQNIPKVYPRDILKERNGASVLKPLRTEARVIASKRSSHVNYDGLEHIAGPGCRSRRGYLTHDISFEEMRHCTTVQCLVPKQRTWNPESDDEDFEVTSNHFLSGLAAEMPSTDEDNPRPIIARHGVEDIEINHYAFSLAETAMPFHPTCFDIFQRASKLHFGCIDIEGLMAWRSVDGYGGSGGRDSVPLSDDPAVRRGSEQEWEHHRQDAYLAANPVFVPALQPILRSAVHEEPSFHLQNSAFPDLVSGVRDISSAAISLDPFLSMPQEITDSIVEHLDSRDIANLRLSSRAFRQLRISLWYTLLRREMPWLWEVWSDDKPSFWASVSINDLMAEKYLRAKYDTEVRSYRPIIRDEMPEIYDEWCAAEPAFEEWAVTCRETYDALKTISLRRNQTNWYELYRDISVNWKQLKGLQNRRRIWKDIEEIIRRIKAYKAEGKIV